MAGGGWGAAAGEGVASADVWWQALMPSGKQCSAWLPKFGAFVVQSLHEKGQERTASVFQFFKELT